MGSLLSAPWHHQDDQNDKSTKIQSKSKKTQLSLESSIISEWAAAVSSSGSVDELKKRIEWDCLDAESIQSFIAAQEAMGDVREHVVNDISLMDSLAPYLTEWSQSGIEDVAADEKRAFIDLFRPFISWGIDRIREYILNVMPTEARSFFSPQAISDLAESLASQLSETSEQLLWHEFNRDRDIDSILDLHCGIAKSDLAAFPRNQYNIFITRHLASAFQSLFNKYPNYYSAVEIILSCWKDSVMETIDRVWADRTSLATMLDTHEIIEIASFEDALGDPHNGRRTVLKVTCICRQVNKTCAKLSFMYKPKDMRLEECFNRFLSTTNSKSKLQPLKSVRVLSGRGYGYCEHICHQLCANNDELSSFYYNAGRLIAILHVFRCTDCHFENLIACGDQLVLIDAETLLEPEQQKDLEHYTESRGLSEHSDYESSVLSIGILPHWVFLGENRVATDISALGISPPDQSRAFKRAWLGINTDAMLQGKVEEDIELPKCLPVGIGTANPLAECTQIVCKGFREQAHEIFTNKELWLQGLESFCGLRRRIVLRPTRIYGALQCEMLSPLCLRSSWNMSLVIEKLARTYLACQHQKPNTWPVFKAEASMMLALDIPMFSHSVDDTKVSVGQERFVDGFISYSGLSLSKRRIEDLSLEGIEFQVRLIQGAIEARVLQSGDNGSSSDNTTRHNTSCNVNTSSIDNIEASLLIAEKVCAISLRSGNGDVQWLGMNLADDGERFSFGPVGISLYGGSMGVACFLSLLRQELVAKNRYKSGKEELACELQVTIDSIIAPLERLIQKTDRQETSRWWRDQSLGLSGAGGVLLALQHLDKNDLVDALIEELTLDRLRKDTHYDIISGCAGLIGPLLAHKTSRSMQLAREAGHILASYVKDLDLSERKASGLILGFAHGAAGIAAALARLLLYFSDDRFVEACKELLAFERSFYNAEVRNWPDLRIGVGSFMTSWCQGAPGIALGRLCLLNTSVFDEQCLNEIQTALNTTASSSGWQRDHICCGSLGSAVLLRLLLDSNTNSKDTEKEVLEAINRVRAQILLKISPKDLSLRCFGSGHGSILLPGLFTGLSGMGLAVMDTTSSRDMLANVLSAGLIGIR